MDEEDDEDEGTDEEMSRQRDGGGGGGTETRGAGRWGIDLFWLPRNNIPRLDSNWKHSCCLLYSKNVFSSFDIEKSCTYLHFS